MMAKLNVESNLDRPDDFYQALMMAHQDLTLEQSQKVNAKLVLLLANHIGDHEILLNALAIARRGLGESL